MVSMADHLLSQQYARLNKPDASVLMEPLVPDEDAARLVEAYQRKDTSKTELLAMIAEIRPFTPPPTTHSVLIDSGTYCSTVAMPLVFKSFITEHANTVVDEMLSRRELVLLEKVSSGGVLLHVKKSETASKLVGQEVSLLGRKFKIKRQSPFLNMFFLDIFGVRTTATANDLFMGFAALGATPLYMTPRDVNMDAQLATTTWRFYFGQAEPPMCLTVRGFVTNQLVYGKRYYLARGRRSLAPPERAGGSKQSPYAVILPSEPIASDSEPTGNRQRAQQCHPPRKGKRSQVAPEVGQDGAALLPSAMHEKALDRAPQNQRDGGENDGPTDDGMDTEMVSAPSDEDEDMTSNMESGFKRSNRSFADENPYDVLETYECNFNDFEPAPTEGIATGVLMVPKLTVSHPSQDAQEPLPTKRRSSNLNAPAKPSFQPDQQVLVSAQATQLETRDDRVTQSMQHLDKVTDLLQHTKNMDSVVESTKTFPLAWSTAICNDLAADGQNVKEISEIHLLDRILADNIDANAGPTFYKRALESHLPLGKTRQTYTKYLSAAVAGKPDEVKEQWGILRLLSSFELLLLSTCPFIFGSSKWIEFLVGEPDEGIPHAHVQLLSSGTLLRLLRSQLGRQLLSKLSERAPASDLLASLSSLRDSELSPVELPTVTLANLSSGDEATHQI